MASPLLLPYQQHWVNDAAPLKLYLKARQIGFSFAETLAEVMECLERPRTMWLLLSCGERQAVELARKAKQHCQSIGAVAWLHENEFVAASRSAGPRFATSPAVREGRALPYLAIALAQHRLEFPNGSMMLALPANPDTARGYAANVLLDEFAFHRDARAIYAAVYPSITRGFRLRIASTPFGESGTFYELWTTQNNFSKHRTDIFQAREQGLGVEIEPLRAGCPDEEIWRQEYCCEFVSDATSWIPWELIVAAEQADERCGPLPIAATGSREEATSDQALDTGRRSPVADLFLGADIARHRDLTVLYVVARLGDVLYTRAIERLQNATFAAQERAIEAAIAAHGVRRCAIDSTGMGAMLAESLEKKFGSRVEAVSFTRAVKEDLALRVKRLFEERRIRIPSDAALRAAIHAVRKYVATAGHFRFDAERTERGHADEFWALALAAYAADAGPVAALAGVDPESAAEHFHRAQARVVSPGETEIETVRQGFFGARGRLWQDRAGREEERE